MLDVEKLDSYLNLESTEEGLQAKNNKWTVVQSVPFAKEEKKSQNWLVSAISLFTKLG